MNVPASTAEIETVARAGSLRETASFDGKKQLPIPKKNESPAIDVAAMSTDGGCLLYGLGEDEEKRLAVEAPFRLADASDHVDQIAQTSIVEPPHIEFREYRTDADPSIGYLLVIVPQSARAPHQVISGGTSASTGAAPEAIASSPKAKSLVCMSLVADGSRTAPSCLEPPWKPTGHASGDIREL